MPFTTTPFYTTSRPVRAAVDRIKTPPGGVKYEHHVSTWAGTMLKKVLHSDDYTLSSEVIDPNEKSKPDFLIEKLDLYDKLVRHLYVELKKVGGDHFEKALHQATKHIQNTIEQGSEQIKECFVVVQRGLDIGFLSTTPDTKTWKSQPSRTFTIVYHSPKWYLPRKTTLLPMKITRKSCGSGIQTRI